MWTLYYYIYLVDNAAYGAKYLWYNGTHTQKSENIQDMEQSALFSIQQTETQHNPFKKCTVFGPCLYNSLQKNIWETSKVLKLKIFNLSSTKFWSSLLMSPKCSIMTPQQQATVSSTN